MDNQFPILVWLERQKQFRLVIAPQELFGESMQVLKLGATAEDKLLADTAYKLGCEG